MSHGKRDPNFRPGEERKVLAAPVLELDQFQFTRAITGALRRAFGGERHAVKRLAEVGGTNETTAKNWLEGRNTPTGLRLLQLAAQVPELRGEIRRLLAMEADGDPELMRDLARVVQQFQRIEEVRRANADMARAGSPRPRDAGLPLPGVGPARRDGGDAHGDGGLVVVGAGPDQAAE